MISLKKKVETIKKHKDIRLLWEHGENFWKDFNNDPNLKNIYWYYIILTVSYALSVAQLGDFKGQTLNLKLL